MAYLEENDCVHRDLAVRAGFKYRIDQCVITLVATKLLLV